MQAYAKFLHVFGKNLFTTLRLVASFFVTPLFYAVM